MPPLYCFCAPLVLVFPAEPIPRPLWAEHDNPLQILDAWVAANRLHLTTTNLYSN